MVNMRMKRFIWSMRSEKAVIYQVEPNVCIPCDFTEKVNAYWLAFACYNVRFVQFIAYFVHFHPKRGNGSAVLVVLMSAYR